jgi:hypothetical protein
VSGDLKSAVILGAGFAIGVAVVSLATGLVFGARR